MGEKKKGKDEIMTGIGVQKDIKKHNKKKCSTCVFFSRRGEWCNYRDITGTSRLAAGGKLFQNGGCSLRIKGEPISSETYRRNIELYTPKKETMCDTSKFANKTDEDRRKMRQLYDSGLSDEKIACAMGFNVKTVRNWRKRNGLESNYIKALKRFGGYENGN